MFEGNTHLDCVDNCFVQLLSLCLTPLPPLLGLLDPVFSMKSEVLVKLRPLWMYLCSRLDSWHIQWLDWWPQIQFCQTPDLTHSPYVFIKSFDFTLIFSSKKYNHPANRLECTFYNIYITNSSKFIYFNDWWSGTCFFSPKTVLTQDLDLVTVDFPTSLQKRGGYLWLGYFSGLLA